MSLDLAELKLRPIPSSTEAQARRQGYRDEVRIDLAGALASEPCLEAKDAGIAGANYYNTAYNPPYSHVVPGSIPELYLRRSAAAKLKQVNARLASTGMELYLFDAWRPQAVQRYFHDHWFPEWLKARRPDLSGKMLADEVAMYWAQPTSAEGSPSPHSTGGAADLTLIFSESRQPLFMGGMFDDVTESAWTDWFEHADPKSMSDEEARANRRLLYWVMSEAGFANNPTEWWHYSWGDQMWARLTGQPAAHYGACHPRGQPDL
jgi:D-alanyl-D-alanine dipeptidase